MEFEDTLYEVLEVSPRASSHVIKAAYRCLAQHHHPDKNAGDRVANERLVRINQAYVVLSDPQRRQCYDRTLGSAPAFVERRGTRDGATRHEVPAAAGHPASRPFGFRRFD